ncbi:hypothetical protein [Nonomuraea lactucae]|uniref:hypothetical protein n=1 Tax=Nonomuraea lactucae TaxID=2249762 RepID=UPI000DE44DD8|nr:hypothetical protein [Nonomuraea lactucae]
MLLYSPNGDEMSLPIGDDPNGELGPDLAKVDQAAELFYRYGHAGRHAHFVGGQVQYLSDRTWFVCLRQAPVGQPVSWVLYAVVDRPTGVPGQFRSEPISALDFAHALAAQGYTVAVRKYDEWTITYDLDAESVPL